MLYTKSRTELKVTQLVDALGVEVYVSTRTDVCQGSDKEKKVAVCVLPSMVMVRLKEKDAAKVFDVPGVVR